MKAKVHPPNLSASLSDGRAYGVGRSYDAHVGPLLETYRPNGRSQHDIAVLPGGLSVTPRTETRRVMNRVDRYIASCLAWNDFWERTCCLSETERSHTFERLVQLYLQTAPEYRTALEQVWLLREVPANIRELLRLSTADEGILIARTRHGEFWA